MSLPPPSTGVLFPLQFRVSTLCPVDPLLHGDYDNSAFSCFVSVVQWPTCFLCAVNQSSFFIGKEADFVIFLQLIVCAVSIYLKTTAGEAVCCKFKQRLREPLE